jgi:hypothetical protein
VRSSIVASDGLRFDAVPATLQLYFQHIRPLALCDAEDGRAVGRLLVDLVNSKVKDLAHAIRGFANRTAMLRDCNLRHMGDMLVATLAANGHSDSKLAPNENEAENPALVTAEQATAIGAMLAARTRSSEVPAIALHQVMHSHPILREMKMQHLWFSPMLEVVLEAADARRHSIMRRLSAAVAPLQAGSLDVYTDVPNRKSSKANFDAVVRSRASEQHPTIRTHLF